MNEAKDYYKILGGISKEFLPDTEKRVLSFSNELEEKRKYNKFTVFKSETDQMIVFNGIKVFSFCEHHLLPYFGLCSIGYIPNKIILGASKFQRAVDKLSSKPTVQESLTENIQMFLEKLLKPKGIAISVTCLHTCMFGRGINTSTATMNTLKVSGKFKINLSTRTEFLSRITKHDNLFS